MENLETKDVSQPKSCAEYALQLVKPAEKHPHH